MQQKYYVYPWAVNGDRTPGGIPDPLSSGGYVSYDQGWTFDYQRNLTTDPAAKAIQRTDMNTALYDATLNLQNYQQYGSPEWITPTNNGGTAFLYDIGAVVRYNGGSGPWVRYVSIATANNQVPGTGNKWQALDNNVNAPQIFSANGNFTMPAGRIRVTVVGGGSGSTGCTAAASAGASGAGGGWAIKVFTPGDITPGTVVAVTVGAGGAGSAALVASGAGGDSTFGSYIRGAGGDPAGNLSGNYNGGFGGIGTGGDLNGSGGDGSDGALVAASATSQWSGVSGGSYLGGSRRSSQSGGEVGIAPGAGASAPYCVGAGATLSGAAGAGGIVIVEYL
jgi:hypothetical protein